MGTCPLSALTGLAMSYLERPDEATGSKLLDRVRDELLSIVAKR